MVRQVSKHIYLTPDLKHTIHSMMFVSIDDQQSFSHSHFQPDTYNEFLRNAHGYEIPIQP